MTTTRTHPRTMHGIHAAFRDASYAAAVEYTRPTLWQRLVRWLRGR